MLKNILRTKKASVWGFGYLGYTTMLKLQNSGFEITAYDFNTEQAKLFQSGEYPSKDQIIVWSRLGFIPKLDLKRIKIAKNPRELFKSSSLHFVAIPENYKDIDCGSVAERLAKVFSKELNDNITPLLIFESASKPGHIEKHFVEPLKKEGFRCSKDYYLGTWFRTDWDIETFISQNFKIPIAGYCRESLEAMRKLFDYLVIPKIELNSIKEAEIYINSVNTIHAMANDFIRQLALGYPAVNIKKLSEVLFRNIRLEGCALNIGTGGERMTFAVDNLIKGSSNPDNLTLLKEFQNINISSVLSYAEYIKRHAYKSVAILGITYEGNQKDLVLSPSVTLAEYLIKNSVKVFLNDPFCTRQEIEKIVKGALVTDFPGEAFSADILILASGHNQYKYLSQSALDKINKKTQLIIDNHGLWSDLHFGKKIKYHQVGDGSLNLLG